MSESPIQPAAEIQAPPPNEPEAKMPAPTRVGRFLTADPQLPADVNDAIVRLARAIENQLAPGPERTVALRKLLESRDSAVRAATVPGG